jgi:hypothetical protein
MRSPLHSEPQDVSPTAQVIEELQLFGYRPLDDGPDPRPLPDADHAVGALAEAFEALAALFTDTRLEPDLGQVLWGVVNVLHRRIDRLQRELDDNEDAQKRSQIEQDGSEIRSVELERLIAEGVSALERRGAFEFLRDAAADLYAEHTGDAWRPLAGSKVNRQALTATLIDSRDFLAARRRAESEVLLPPGPKVAFTGGTDCNDHGAIWAALDRVHAKHADMVLLHGGAPRGAERIAACWADHRKIPQIVFKPDWARHQKAAPFRRNDAMLEALPIGVVVFPGSGISDNLADKARGLGIPLFDFRARGA